jgi:hypothetical protein
VHQVGWHTGNALDSYTKGALFESQLGKPVIVTEAFRGTLSIQENSGIVPRLAETVPF